MKLKSQYNISTFSVEIWITSWAKNNMICFWSFGIPLLIPWMWI
jgi:hypothetical protein